MEHPPAPATPWASWAVASDLPYADRVGHAVARWARHQALGTHAWFVYPLLGVLAVAGAVIFTPWTLLLVVATGAAWTWDFVLHGRLLAHRIRLRSTTLPGPYTVAIDGEGLHVVSAHGEQHLRWRLFHRVAIDGDVLLLRQRGPLHVQGLPIAPLDPSVDRGRLVDAVNRQIVAEAPAGAPTGG